MLADPRRSSSLLVCVSRADRESPRLTVSDRRAWHVCGTVSSSQACPAADRSGLSSFRRLRPSRRRVQHLASARWIASVVGADHVDPHPLMHAGVEGERCAVR